MNPPMNLNQRTWDFVQPLLERAELDRTRAHQVEGGGWIVDCGVKVRGGLRIGLEMARACLANLADVALTPGDVGGRSCPRVQVATDHPIAACLASQYAGWALQVGGYFAMGSGPMRAAYGRETLFDDIGLREDATAVVGVLEGRKLPTPEVFAKIAEGCRVERDRIVLLIAPTASVAGSAQIVARSVETALHKLHKLGFDLGRVVSGYGEAPLPPVAKNDLAGIGRTNDAILYGAKVLLHVTGDDDSLREIGPKIPSNSSSDYGEPFEAIFARYHHDFYKVDPYLFSPAAVTLQNLETGRTHVFGAVDHDVLVRSFYSGA